LVKVRPYDPCDKEDVREVCIVTGPSAARDDAKVRAWLLSSFCDYYIEQEPDNCFVLADMNDKAVGYILCAEDYYSYKRTYLNRYVKAAKKQGGILAAIRTAVVVIPQWFYAKKYPAHLHIDIQPYYQRQGWGSKMMDALLDHLRQKGVKAVMLIVGAYNKKGINFYKKYGFHEISRFFGSVAMGMELNND
jgi:ribosomal protein S18 acetylase RimI-like enzyme